MQDNSNGDTAPIRTQSILTEQNEPPPSKPKRWPWILIGLVIILIGGLLGAALGYQRGVAIRKAREEGTVLLNATTQYQLGIQEFEAGRYEIARKRFEFVIQLKPDFPGASQKLAEVMLAQAMVEEPTMAPTPTTAFTPTPDLRGEEELFRQAQEDMLNKQWDAVITTLDKLRKLNIGYRTVEADGMYYMALRFRGIDKILLQGSLEGGIYDLALSERFAPLDRDADGYRTWARMYLAGASFWGLDWPRVIEYFSQIVAALPNLRDGSNWTAIERYRVAFIRYGDQLVLVGSYCDAVEQYENGLSIGYDQKAEESKAYALKLCQNPADRPEVVETAPPEVDSGGETVVAPTAEPTNAPENTPVPEPTEAPPTEESAAIGETSG